MLPGYVPKFVMDRGFYSENNINGLYRVISSRINAVSTSITTTASKKVLMTSRLSTSGSLSFSQSCRKANLSRSIRKVLNQNCIDAYTDPDKKTLESQCKQGAQVVLKNAINVYLLVQCALRADV